MTSAIIYAAGNPDLYPLEYYDQASGSYQGLIPELLQQFSDQTSYDIRYYNPDDKDQRAELAAARQVDLISGCTAAESFDHTDGQAITLLESMEDGETVTYQLRLTDIAPAELQADLQAFLTELAPAAKTGLLIEAAGQPEFISRGQSITIIGGLIIAIAVLAAVIVATKRKYTRRLMNLEANRETDEITGIGNPEYLAHYYKTFVNDKNRVLYSMIYFDIDMEHLERVTDYAEINEFLRYTAAILQEHTADTDILARITDHGFVMLRLSGDEHELTSWLEPVLNRIREYSQRYDKPYVCDVAAAIYKLKQDDLNLSETLLNVSRIARAAHQEGDSYRFCTEEMTRSLMEAKKLQADIRHGLEHGEFMLYVQFYVDTQTYKIAGGESLSRWNHPQRGFISAGSFIPLLEQEGMISDLDYYNLDKTCAFLAELHRQNCRSFFISCNFSRRTLEAADFVTRCREIIERYDFNRDRLFIEITESTLTKDSTRLRRNMTELKQLGVCIALDDFGEGFTSLFDLQEYPIDGVKLDKSLTDQLGSEKGRTIMNALIHVCHELGLKILVEGVENDEQIKILQESHCGMIQGFRFHYPIPAWEAEQIILSESDGSEAAEA